MKFGSSMSGAAASRLPGSVTSRSMRPRLALESRAGNDRLGRILREARVDSGLAAQEEGRAALRDDLLHVRAARTEPGPGFGIGPLGFPRFSHAARSS